MHDCAKYLSGKELLDFCMKHQLPVSSIEKKAPYLLHAKAGAYLAEHRYGITDQEILSAVRWHTTGKPEMSNLEQIIFCADYIEPGRTKQPNLPYLRGLAGKNLTLLTYHILKDTVDYLQKVSPETMDCETSDAYAYYKNILDGRSI